VGNLLAKNFGRKTKPKKHTQLNKRTNLISKKKKRKTKPKKKKTKKKKKKKKKNLEPIKEEQVGLPNYTAKSI